MAVDLQGNIIDEEGKKLGGQVDLNTGVLTSSSFINSPTPNFQGPSYSSPYPVAGLGTAPLEMTAPEKKAQDQIGQISDLNNALVGQSAYRAEQEQAQGVQALTQTQNDLSSRLTALKNEALAIPMQIQQDATGRGVTAGGIRPHETAALRNNAIQALSVNSLLEASRGNLTMALDMVNRAVSQKFDPIKEEIAVKMANLDLILKSPEYSVAEKNRAQKQVDIQEAKKKALDKQEAIEKERHGYAVDAASLGADSTTLNNIQNAKTPEAALRLYSEFMKANASKIELKQIVDTAAKYGADAETIAAMQGAGSPEQARVLGAQYLQDPKAKYELEKMRLDNILKLKDINKAGERKTQVVEENGRKFLIDSITGEVIKSYDDQLGPDGVNPDTGNPYTPAELKTRNTNIAQAKSAIPELEIKIQDIDDLIDSPGMKGTVGTYGFSRFTPLAVDKAERINFAAGVHQLSRGETLATLLELKKQGGTLGAVNEREFATLEGAATRLNDWEIMDDNGLPSGRWEVSEADFKAELRKLKGAAQRLLDSYSQNLLASDEKTALSSFFTGPTDISLFDATSLEGYFSTNSQ